MPTALERLVWGFGDGSTIPVVDSAVGRIGSVICWENYMPLLRIAMYAQGIELYCAPTVDIAMPGYRRGAPLRSRALLRSLCLPISDANGLPAFLQRHPGRHSRTREIRQ